MPNLFQNLFPQRREYRSIVDSIDQSMQSVSSAVSRIQTLHYNAQDLDVKRFTNDQLVNQFRLAEARLEALNTFHELERNANDTGRNAHQSLTAMLPRSRSVLEQINLQVMSLPFHEPQRLPNRSRKGVGRRPLFDNLFRHRFRSSFCSGAI
jgi:hypothetical protein